MNRLQSDIKGQSKKGESQKLDKKTRNGVLLRLSKYILQHKFLFAIAIVLTLASNQLALMGPQFSGDAIDAMASQGNVDFEAVWQNVVYMLACYIASAVLSYMMSVLMIHISQKIVYTMRRELFEKLTSLPIGYFDTHPAGDMISRISYDIDTVNTSLSTDLVQVLTSIYTVVGSLVFMWQISKPLIIVFAITVPISVIMTQYRSKKVRPLFHKRSSELGELNGYAEEMLSGGRTISAYGMEEEISSRFGKRNKQAMDADYTAEYYGALLGPSVGLVNNLSLSLIMILGGIMYMFSNSGAIKEASLFFISLGGVAKFVQYSRKFAGPINEFAQIMNEFQSAFSAAERVFRILDENPEPADSPEALPLNEVNGDVKLNDITFSYTKGRTILKNVDIQAEPGKTIAIVGPTGAGKTTIINLLMRFYEPDSGEITVDGTEIHDLKRSDLRRAYTMVLQDTWLFGGTIYENIAYGKEDATMEEVREAARAAKMESYIEHLPNGYDTVISDDGVNISKGQRQLITIARAMLMNEKTHMLILDEATSNVDSRTEILIQEAMKKLMNGKTSFVIAHRLSTIRNADMILVLQNGEITESGTHDELMQKGGFYATLYNSQFV
ncbi:MAG: ABC transporter ATP-binding protein/permease [Oscillospiraceae bacterium]|nr:ABC transporter ATP-binding protein/permease [Oscillospiraceae bacterium]